MRIRNAISAGGVRGSAANRRNSSISFQRSFAIASCWMRSHTVAVVGQDGLAAAVVVVVVVGDDISWFAVTSMTMTKSAIFPTILNPSISGRKNWYRSTLRGMCQDDDVIPSRAKGSRLHPRDCFASLAMTVLSFFLFVALPPPAAASHRWTLLSNACVALSPAADVEAAPALSPLQVKDLRVIVGQEPKFEVDKSILDDDFAISDIIGEDIKTPKPRIVRLRLRYTGDLPIPAGDLKIYFSGRIGLLGTWELLRYQRVGGFSALPMEDPDGSKHVDFYLDHQKVVSHLWQRRCDFKENFNGLRILGYGIGELAADKPFFRVTRKKKLGGSRKNGGKWWPNDPSCTPTTPEKK